MSVLKGYNGSIDAGSNTVGEVKSFTVTQSADIQETSSLGNAWATNTSTIKRWTASLEANFDIADSGQVDLRPGDEVAATFYVGGTSGAGNASYSGTLVVESFDITNDVAGIVSVSISGTGSGALTESVLV